MTISDITRRVSKFTIDNSPSILTGLAVAGTVATVYLTGKATFRAADIIREDAYIAGLNADPQTTREKVELVWKLYIPAAGTGVMAISCMIAANRIGTRRAAAMAAAYTIADKALTEYKEKVIETIGAKKEAAIKDSVAQDQVTSSSTGREVILIGNGDVLFLDSYSGRYFKSAVESIKKAQNDINYQLIHEFSASLNEFYNKIGLSSTEAGSEVGWNMDRQMEVTFSGAMTETQEPCLVMNFAVTPVRGYHKIN